MPVAVRRPMQSNLSVQCCSLTMKNEPSFLGSSLCLMNTEYKHPLYISSYSKSKGGIDVFLAKIKNQADEL